MESKVGATSKCEQRVVIKFLNAEGVKGKEIHEHLNVMQGKNSMNRAKVYKWIRFFNGSGTEVHDEKRSGQPLDLVNKETVSIVHALMVEDRHFALTDLYYEIAMWYSYVMVGRTSIYNILRNELGMCKVNARWVPCQLTKEHRAQRMGATLEFLTWYDNEGDQYQDRIVTEDETWVHLWTPERRKNRKFGKRWMNQLQRSLKKYHLPVKLWLRSSGTKRVLFSSTICLMQLILRQAVSTQ